MMENASAGGEVRVDVVGEERPILYAELKKELFNLRFQNAINQLDNPHRIDDVKKDIARVMTILHEKNA